MTTNTVDGAPRLRKVLLVLATLTVVSTATELIFLEHWGSTTQLIPWFALILVSVAIAMVWRRPTRRVLRGARIVALVAVACSVWGFVEHLLANREFAVELHPEWGSVRLFWEGLSGKLPVLAALAVALGGLLTATATIEHPGLQAPVTEVESSVPVA